MNTSSVLRASLRPDSRILRFAHTARNATKGDGMTRMSIGSATSRRWAMRICTPVMLLTLCAAAPAAAQSRADAGPGSVVAMQVASQVASQDASQDASLDAVNALVLQRTKAKGAGPSTGARSKTKSATSPARKPSDAAAAVAPPKGWAPLPSAPRPAAKRR